MRLVDIMTAPWALLPEKLREIQAVYETHLRGEKIDLKTLEARLGEPLGRAEQGYEVIKGSALIPVDGVISKRMNLLSKISGGLSTQMLERDVSAALADNRVQSIILVIDSPGGSVDGVQQVADAIYAARGKKPMYAVAEGMMASAAYWLGSAVDKVYINDGTTQVGSIGVLATHRDISQAEARVGVKVTEIYAGKYKRIATEHAPLSDAGRQVMQDQVDYMYSVFVDDIARHRGVSVERVLENMADGRVFIGQQAIEAGLVDGVSTVAQLVEALASSQHAAVPAGRTIAGAASSKVEAAAEAVTDVVREDPLTAVSQLTAGEEQMGDKVITLESLKTESPQVADALVVEGIEKGRAQETARMKAVKDQLLPGHEKLIETLMFDGKTTGPEAAAAVLAAERTARDVKRDGLRADAEVLKVPASSQVKEKEPVKQADDVTLPIGERAKAEWDSTPAIRAEFGGDYDGYLAYRKAEDGGQVRYLKTNIASK